MQRWISDMQRLRLPVFVQRDWRSFLQIARRHDVFIVINRLISRLDVNTVPCPCIRFFDVKAYANRLFLKT